MLTSMIYGFAKNGFMEFPASKHWSTSENWLSSAPTVGIAAPELEEVRLNENLKQFESFEGFSEK